MSKYENGKCVSLGCALILKGTLPSSNNNHMNHNVVNVFIMIVMLSVVVIIIVANFRVFSRHMC
jgi:hypothetical protein